MAKPKEGHELLQVTVSNAAAKFVRLLAAVEGVNPGVVVDRLIRDTMCGSPLESLVAGAYGDERQTTGESPARRRAAKAPGRAQEAQEDLAALWGSLEALRQAQGLTDKVLADAFHIDKANLPQWRRKGSVPASKAEAVRRFLADQA